LYRERKKRGAADSAIEKERKILKPMTHDRIEDHLAREFGSAAMKPVGDLDRPFTPAELRDFARDPLVHLGNHTADHAILVNYDEAGVRAQMSKAQEDLAGMTGTAPRTVSYPNGNSNPMVRRVARELGFDLGIGLEYRKNPLPMDPNSAMDIGRFLPWGDAPFEAQWEVFRSDFVPGNLLRRRFKKGY
jgi:peptidoglycan/xylan/chitin deacetylase (PgdA/CDA1 family)